MDDISLFLCFRQNSGDFPDNSIRCLSRIRGLKYRPPYDEEIGSGPYGISWGGGACLVLGRRARGPDARNNKLHSTTKFAIKNPQFVR